MKLGVYCVILCTAVLILPITHSHMSGGGGVVLATEDNEVSGVAIDSTNDVIVVGQHNNGDHYVIRLQKYDGDTGQIIWQTDFDEYSDNIGKAVVVDSNDNIYVGGIASVGLGELIPKTDYIIVKYDKNGNKIVSKTYDLRFADFLMDIGVDSSNNIYATGMVLDISDLSELVDMNIWTIKVSPDNLNKLSEQVFDKEADAAFGIGVRGTTVAVAGAVETNEQDGNAVTKSQSQYCLVKYSTGLDFTWDRYYPQSPPSFYNATGSDAAILSNGYIVITGNDEEDFCTIAYDSLGSVKWNKKETSSDKDDALTIASDSQDNVISGGYQTKTNKRMWYLVKYDKNGNRLAQKPDSDVNGEIKRIAVDKNNSIVAVGYKMVGDEEEFCVRKYTSALGFVWEGSDENAPPPPNAKFHWLPQSPTRADNVHFIDDSGGLILSRQWSFGDGTTSNQQSPWHQYANVGTFTVTLTITISSGQLSVSKTVNVTNAPPVPVFTYQPPNPVESVVVTFNGGASSDADGSIVSYSWSFGDGATGSGQTTTHAYTTNGAYTVTLTVTDSDGASRSTSKTVTVNTPNGHEPPIPSFTVSDTSPKAGAIVTFNASTSYDPDGTILLYKWDWNGDGIYENADMFTIPMVTHRFAEGVYNVTLLVEDNHSMSNTYTVEVNVRGIAETVINLTISDITELKRGTATEVLITITSSINLTGVTISVEKNGNITVETGNSFNLLANEEKTVTLTITTSEEGSISLKAIAADGHESDVKMMQILLKSDDGNGTPSFTIALVCMALGLALIYFRRRHG